MNTGTVYLICFDQNYKHARHYIGFAKTDVQQRMEKHLTGSGARLLAVLVEAGITFKLVRSWPDVDRHFERKLKNRKNSKQLCPRCSSCNDAGLQA